MIIIHIMSDFVVIDIYKTQSKTKDGFFVPPLFIYTSFFIHLSCSLEKAENSS